MRKILFGLHWVTGVLSGMVLLSMSLTGALLTFEPQIVATAEQQAKTVSPPPIAEGFPPPRQLPLSHLLERAKDISQNRNVSSIALSASPTEAATLSFGRDGDTFFLNPYTGEVVGKASTIRKAMHLVEEWHRWLGSRAIGKPITGLCCLLFVVLVFSGLYLWIPRPWSWPKLRWIAIPRFERKDKARHWNWHHAIGVWFAPLFLLTGMTGTTLSYSWAQTLFFGSKEKPAPMAPSEKAVHLGQWVDSIPAMATAQMPTWKSLILRIPKSSREDVQLTIISEGPFSFLEKSQMRFKTASGERTASETYASQSLRQKIRQWIKPLHTGQAFGWVGQSIMGITALMASLMVYTGFSLAWRRFRRVTSRNRNPGPKTAQLDT
jgi:uncharacterized iron-regulated membrane protein